MGNILIATKGAMGNDPLTRLCVGGHVYFRSETAETSQNVVFYHSVLCAGSGTAMVCCDERMPEILPFKTIGISF